MSDSRYKNGGFEPRFIVRRTDGKPCRPGARYFVIDYAGGDPHAVEAVLAYALSVENENPQLAADLKDALANPEKYPTQHEGVTSEDAGKSESGQSSGEQADGQGQ